jgi:drug/metabolite transporter (DMT)-like permease
MVAKFWHSNPGIFAALGAALLFGAGTPFAKLLLGPVSPWLLAGLLYLGSGSGLFIWRLLRRTKTSPMSIAEMGWLAGAVLAGGMIAPALLMWGLVNMPASGASLLLNAEGVLTALIAWFVFRENFDRRIALGMVLIIAGAVVLSWPKEMSFGAAAPSLAVVGACLFWAIDNNLTRKVALLDSSFIAMTKGLVAGAVNTAIALALGSLLPSMPTMAAAATVGLLSYGVSLMLFVVALRHLGTARTGAYFSTAPFAGAVIAVAGMGEPITVELLIAGTLMAAGVWLHLTERHDHMHDHDVFEHEHHHEHDAHHQHAHAEPVSAGTRHSHVHRHEPMTHSHAHSPDAHHHQHRHANK